MVMSQSHSRCGLRLNSRDDCTILSSGASPKAPTVGKNVPKALVSLAGQALLNPSLIFIETFARSSY